MLMPYDGGNVSSTPQMQLYWKATKHRYPVIEVHIARRIKICLISSDTASIGRVQDDSRSRICGFWWLIRHLLCERCVNVVATQFGCV